MLNVNVKLTDTLIGKKRDFIPLTDKKVKIYVCGITPYDFPHIGHGRVYVTFDVLVRFLKFLGFDVTYCRNFTDIDDKLLDKARAEFGDELRYQEIAERYISGFKKNMGELNCLIPDFEPKVTQTIPEIIDFVQGLIKAGKAYQVNGDVYFHVRSFPDYGKLSKRDLNELKVGARVEVNDVKKDPLDFALWKSESTGTFWKSPWGYGRPGWHIECSAMSRKFLGDQIDIHGGGMDLIFPHHENEIAQSEGLIDKKFVQYWVHNAFVRINKEKMSKSLGNFFTLNDVFKDFDPMVIRFYYLNHSYNSPLDFSFDDIVAFQKSYQRLCKIFTNVDAVTISRDEIVQSEIGSKMLSFLADDLNTPGLFGVVFENLKDIEFNVKEVQDLSPLAPSVSRGANGLKEAQVVKYILQNILGLTLIPLTEKVQNITPEIQALLDARQKARESKDWAKADAIRDQLKELSYDVQDKKL